MTNTSVIIACYNSAKFLSSTIESVLNQTSGNWELILVDDGSLDDTWEIIKKYMTIDPKIKGFTKKNEGTSKTRNFGFENSNPLFSYIFFLDHDDQLAPDALRQMSKYLDEHPDVGLLGCQLQNLSEDGTLLSPARRSRWAPGSVFPHELQDNEYNTPFVTFFCATGQGPFALHRRSVYLQTDGWETDFWPHEDTDLFCQMALITKVHFLPDPLYLKRIHPAQGMNDGARVQQAYGAFREKWDKRIPKNDREAQILRDAKIYYYSKHRPFRSLKVGSKAFKELLLEPNLKRLQWFLFLTKDVMSGFLFGRFKT